MKLIQELEFFYFEKKNKTKQIDTRKMDQNHECSIFLKNSEWIWKVKHVKLNI